MSPKLVKTTFSQLYFEMKILLSMLVTDHVSREGYAVICVHLFPGFLLNHVTSDLDFFACVWIITTNVKI